MQPDKLKLLIGREDDGLLARCLVSYPRIDRAPDLPARSARSTANFEGVLRHVLALPAASTAFGGHSVLLAEHAWRSVGAATWRWERIADETEGLLASTYNRATIQALRLALMLAIFEHVLAGKDGLPAYVNDDCARAAIRLLDERYLPSTERALDVAQARLDQDAELQAIARFIARHVDGLFFNARVLRQARRAPCYRDHAAWTRVLERLVRLGCISEVPRRNATGRGRTDYRAHPAFVEAACWAR